MKFALVIFLITYHGAAGVNPGTTYDNNAYETLEKCNEAGTAAGANLRTNAQLAQSIAWTCVPLD